MNTRTDNVSQPKKRFWLYAISFVTVLLLSLLVHMPASWVLNHSSLKNALQQQGVELSQAQGSIWNGKTQLRMRTKAPNSVHNLGQVAWQFKPLKLLSLKGEVALQWQFKSSKLAADVAFPLLSLEQLQASHVNGKVLMDDAIPLAIELLPPSATRNIQLLQSAKGQLEVIQAQAMVDLSTQKPTQMTAEAKVVQLDFMGNQFPVIDIQAEQKEATSPVMIDLLSSAENWNLQGRFSSPDWQRFGGELNLKASSPQALPDWAFTLRKKTATHYFVRF